MTMTGMQKGMAVLLRGSNIVDTAKMLAVRLLEMGRNVEHLDEAAVKRLGGPASAAHACDLLTRNGVIAVITHPKLKPRGGVLEIEVDAHDTPDFAAEKILDELAAAGVIALESTGYSPEEEELIRKRLADLGYIE